MQSQNRIRARRLGAVATLLFTGLAAGALALGGGSLRASGASGFSPTAKLPQLGSGRIWSLSVAPTTPPIILAGTDKGVYISPDSGVSWQLTLPGIRVWCVGFDSRNPANALAGTDGKGVYTSSDSGRTWTASGTGLPNKDVRGLAFGLDGIAAATDSGVGVSPDGRDWHPAGLDGYTISSIAVVANTPQFTLIAGADGGNLSAGFLFRSSGGSAWEVLQSGLPAQAVVSSVTAGPIDQAFPKRPLLVITTKGAFRSGDGGNTWTSSTGVPEAVTLTTAVYSSLDPNLVYAGADAGASSGGGLVRSIDSGMTFSTFDSGLPASKNVAAIAVAPTKPPVVLVGLDPPSGGGAVYADTDTTAPAPPVLTAEAPGGSVPTVVATAVPTPTPSRAPSPTPSPRPAPQGAFQQFASSAFHWPTPLLYEIIFVLLVAYIVVRWRQRYYVEGPP